jgi:hypothetical protein
MHLQLRTTPFILFQKQVHVLCLSILPISVHSGSQCPSNVRIPCCGRDIWICCFVTYIEIGTPDVQFLVVGYVSANTSTSGTIYEDVLYFMPEATLSPSLSI